MISLIEEMCVHRSPNKESDMRQDRVRFLISSSILNNTIHHPIYSVSIPILLPLKN